MTDDQVAFALKADYDLDSAGAIVVNHHRDLNVRAALEDNDGVYVTADADEIRTLDAYPPVKRVPVPESPADIDPDEQLKPAAGKTAKTGGKE
jgi:hypothetical protein